MPAYCDVDGVPCHASTELLDRDPPRRVGLRRHRRLGLHRRRDDRHGPPADRRPRRGRAAGARRRRRRRAAADRRLRRRRSTAASTTAGSSDDVPRCDRRAGAPDEVPAGPLRPAVRRGPRRGDPRRPRRRRGSRRPRARGALAGPRQERRPPAARRGQPPRVAVIGPIADSARDLLGDYSHLVHMETLREMHSGRGRPGDRRRWRGHRGRGRRAGRPAHDPRRAPRVPGRRRSGPRPRHRDIGGDRRGAGRRGRRPHVRPMSRSSCSASARA